MLHNPPRYELWNSDTETVIIRSDSIFELLCKIENSQDGSYSIFEDVYFQGVRDYSEREIFSIVKVHDSLDISPTLL